MTDRRAAAIAVATVAATTVTLSAGPAARAATRPRATPTLAATASHALAPPAAVLQRTVGVAAGRVGVVAARTSLPSGAKLLGRATDDVDVLVGLRLRDESKLDAFITQVTDPKSKRYAHYLSPAQFHARYAPSSQAIAAIKSFAKANHMTVGKVPANHAFVELKGSAAAASRAFGVTLRAAKLVGGQLAHLPVGTPSVPAALRRAVTGVEGLDTTHPAHPNTTTGSATPSAAIPAAYVNAQPCSAYWGEKLATNLPAAYGQTTYPYVPCGYTPQQLRSAYGVDQAAARGLDGSGVKVGIIDAYAAKTVVSDTNTYSARHGLPPVKYTDVSAPGAADQPQVGGLTLPIGDQMVPPVVDPAGWSGEQTLDVEAVHAMAPNATIVYDGAEGPEGPLLTIAQTDMVDNARAQIVSNSYGSASDDADASTDALLKQAAAQGIGFYFSAGDEGDETQDPNGPGDRETDADANNPLATAVGGTSLGVGSGGQYLFETGWGTTTSTLTNNAWTPALPGDFSAGGGGGTSQVYAQPAYQKGVVPDSIASYFKGKPPEKSQAEGTVPGTKSDFTAQIPGRAVPDVAMVGDSNTGFLMGQTQDFSEHANPLGAALPSDDVHYGEYRIGGTSLSSPLFAGMMALADQAAGKAHGFANPALYALSKDPTAFRDIVDPKTPTATVRVDYKNQTDASGGTNTLLRTFNQTQTIHTIPGYDDVTGLGTPMAIGLIKGLAPRSSVFGGAR